MTNIGGGAFLAIAGAFLATTSGGTDSLNPKGRRLQAQQGVCKFGKLASFKFDKLASCKFEKESVYHFRQLNAKQGP